MLRRTFKVSSRCLIIAQKLQKQKFFVSPKVRFLLRCKGKRARWTSWHRNKTFSQENSHNCKSFWMKKKLSKMVAKYKGGKEWEMRKSEKERKICNFPLYVYIRTLPMILQRKTKSWAKFLPFAWIIYEWISLALYAVITSNRNNLKHLHNDLLCAFRFCYLFIEFNQIKWINDKMFNAIHKIHAYPSFHKKPTFYDSLSSARIFFHPPSVCWARWN